MQYNQPFGYVLITGHGSSFAKEIPECLISEAWVPVYKWEAPFTMGRESLQRELENQGAVVLVRRNTAGQISLCAPDGGSWDMSKHVGAALYSAPTTPPDTRELVEALEALYHEAALRSSPDTRWESPMMTKARAALTKHRESQLVESKRRQV